MNKRNSLYLFQIMILTTAVFVLFINNTTQVAGDTMLVAYKTHETMTLDGADDEDSWKNASRLVIQNYDGEAVDVDMRFMHNGSHVFFFATWDDPFQNDSRKLWVWNATSSTYDNTGDNEDRFTVAWSNNDASIVCGHNPGTSDGMLFDVWHWKATRTAPAGWTDDKYWDGSGRHSDSKTSGGYSDNSVVVQAGDASAITAKLGNSTAVSAYGAGDLPFWYANGTEIPWSSGTLGGAWEIPTTVGGYLTSLPVGSRGDVLTEAQFASSKWSIETVRKMDTGNADDIPFAVDGEYLFYFAIHDEAGDWAHYKDTSISLTVTFSNDFGGGQKTVYIDVPTTIYEPTTEYETVYVSNNVTITPTEDEAGFPFFLTNIFIVSSMVMIAIIAKRKR
ncbi:MAG: ethylbenzene dehydrogenase-related protein [Candidatus Heimdallarchaeota archaeon]|nr:ethylbenzene dehydrogenase-related protein [Candidatus Heimdallarchaeota archaeon]MDH5645301.1 ethylbenzene dehydrogenase-related protein [Candidatus Heimdallarchaeota archaeon]